MTEIKRMRDQLRRSIEGEAWHGDSVLDILKGISAEQAAARPIKKAHTIWEILLHINNCANEVSKRLTARAKGDMTPDEAWPPQPKTPSDKAWRSEIDRLVSLNAEIDKALGDFDSARLDEPLMDYFSSAYRTVHGHTQHNLYHAGQMALVKKLV